MITINDLNKIDLRVGEVIEVSNNSIKIKCNNKEYSFNSKINVNNSDKIVIIIKDNKVSIPILEDNTPIVSEKDIKEGSKIR